MIIGDEVANILPDTLDCFTILFLQIGKIFICPIILLEVLDLLV